MTRARARKLCVLAAIVATALLGATVATAQRAVSVYALYVTQATTDGEGNAVVACQVVDRILWDGVAAYASPVWGLPPVPTALLVAGSLQIGQIVTGAPPNCP